MCAGSCGRIREDAEDECYDPRLKNIIITTVKDCLVAMTRCRDNIFTMIFGAKVCCLDIPIHVNYFLNEIDQVDLITFNYVDSAISTFDLKGIPQFSLGGVVFQGPVQLACGSQ